jgi:hypothetical protein
MNFIEIEFNKLAKQFGTNYKIEEFNNSGFGSSSFATTIYSIAINYKSEVINLKYELGNQNMAEIKCELGRISKHKEFHTRKKNQILKKLFDRNSNSIKVIGISTQINQTISKLLYLSGMDEFAANSEFCPTITGIYKEEFFVLDTSFYLGIRDKEKILHAVVKFYIMYIDEMS